MSFSWTSSTLSIFFYWIFNRTFSTFIFTFTINISISTLLTFSEYMIPELWEITMKTFKTIKVRFILWTFTFSSFFNQNFSIKTLNFSWSTHWYFLLYTFILCFIINTSLLTFYTNLLSWAIECILRTSITNTVSFDRSINWTLLTFLFEDIVNSFVRTI